MAAAMTTPENISVWLQTSHHAAFRVGGWAYVRKAGGELSGMAGGGRQTTIDQNGLSALIAALGGLPAGATVTVHSSDPVILACGAHLMGVAKAPPENDLDLWGKLQAAANGRTVVVRPVKADPKTPSAFAVAWAELSRDKAKAAGPFTAAIPKTNLGKLAI